VEYPAYHKTQMFGAPPYLKKHERKKWAIDTVQRLLTERSQEYLLNDFKKKDDVSDCLLQGLAYIKQHDL
jgi:hypothetical protein